MRIGVVVTSPVFGGGERYILDLYGELRSQGIAATLLGDVPHWPAELGAHVSLGSSGKWSRSRLLRSAALAPTESRRALRIIRREQATEPFDLFQLQYKREQVLLTRALSRLAPVVWIEHGTLARGLLGRPLRRAYAAASRHATAIVCVSDHVAAEVASLCGPRTTRVITIHTGIDTQRFAPPTDLERLRARRAFEIDDRARVVGVVSRLAPGKRVELAIDAVHRVPRAALLIAGDGPDAGHLRQRKLDGRVRFLGQVSDPRDIYRSADVLALPTTGRGEGLPLALLEAAAMGVPTVAANDSGLGACAEASGGAAAEPTARAFAAALVTVAEERERRAVARAWACSHDYSAWARAYSELYTNLAHGASTAGRMPRSPRS